VPARFLFALTLFLGSPLSLMEREREYMPSATHTVLMCTVLHTLCSLYCFFVVVTTLEAYW
jgi:hypothetical protein